MIAPQAEGGREARRQGKRADGLVCQACIAPAALGFADDFTSCLAGVKAIANSWRTGAAAVSQKKCKRGPSLHSGLRKNFGNTPDRGVARKRQISRERKTAPIARGRLRGWVGRCPDQKLSGCWSFG